MFEEFQHPYYSSSHIIIGVVLLAIIVRVDKERREDRNGIAHLKLLTVFTPYKVDDVNPILLPAVGWVYSCCNTGSHVPQECCL